MRIGDLIRFRSIGVTPRREDLFIVMGREAPPHDRNDVFMIVPISLTGETFYCNRRDVEVLSEVR